MGDPRNAGENITSHKLISSYFIGPRAENMEDFETNIAAILAKIKNTRLSYQPNTDGQEDVFISNETRTKLKPIRDNFTAAVGQAAETLGKQSIPFWHPRYQGHMCTDMTMPGLLGYFMTMIYSPNNVAVEGGPFTTVVELRVGKQLCNMDMPLSWGHITCYGTVANLESIWVARNLKFYPLSLYHAMREGPLGFIADDFWVNTCVGEEKLFKDLGVWELLNLRPEQILDMGEALYQQFGITSKYLEEALKPFSIQTTGKDVLENEFRIKKPAKYLLAQTRHYSWPKGGAIAGIGSANMQGVEVDMEGHISLDALEKELNHCLEQRQAVYAVVAVIGTIEEGAVDQLHDILAMRRRFQDRGLSFLVHADAAWGGYFASMIPRERMNLAGPIQQRDREEAVQKNPQLPLREDTLKDLIALREADTITVDPHKAGYIPYPAGSLCYRDDRMRFFVTWTSPYLTQGSMENIGVYGVEGSKPGAAAMAAWMSNQTIGLDPTGYGRLLGEAAFTSARLSVCYAAMHAGNPLHNRKYIIVPFNPLPKEKEGFDCLSGEVDVERRKVLDCIINRTEADIEREGWDAHLPWLRQIGSDLNINAFAINWYRSDGTLNRDLEEANYLMRRVVNRLSITSTRGDPQRVPLFLTSTQFEPAMYGQCAQNFMRRLGLDACDQDLWVIRNVDTFEKEIIEGVDWCRKRNSLEDKKITFLLRGTDKIFLDFQTSFHAATQRQQIILEATLMPKNTDLASSNDAKMKVNNDFIDLKRKNPDKVFAFESSSTVNLEALIKGIEEGPRIVGGSISAPGLDPESTIECRMEMKRVVISRPLNSTNRDDHYPRHLMPFYLYGSQNEFHISHMLLQAPNVNLSACGVTFTEALPQRVLALLERRALILTLTEYREETMHPLPETNSAILENDNFFFRPGQRFQVKIFEDHKEPNAKGPGLIDNLRFPIAREEMTLNSDVHVDVEALNKDPLEEEQVGTSWESELDQVREVLNYGHVAAMNAANAAIAANAGGAECDESD
ncbi:pyridoxal-dependent decarboxylase domain protein [Aspergillus piperis CBS 112811]|uniref:Pyridoxal-dependent decarboxylase domain protein n=1 Tax=Aspergillus piperis CBS 112811 TaxID=1448313 RepID=A0A8G1QR74_9EURO|nr:pyridoxal-dependent decarboxylase domain protein [Aspergillus piperis CBS 112811]RAH52097.1 pyridoxal-dependent decarboxylase domain protein [Aspergillus piperis CBS 112811]